MTTASEPAWAQAFRDFVDAHVDACVEMLVEDLTGPNSSGAPVASQLPGPSRDGMPMPELIPGLLMERPELAWDINAGTREVKQAALRAYLAVERPWPSYFPLPKHLGASAASARRTLRAAISALGKQALEAAHRMDRERFDRLVQQVQHAQAVIGLVPESEETGT